MTTTIGGLPAAAPWLIVFAGRLATLELHISGLGDRTARGNVGKTAVTQHGGFQRQLRRQAGADLLLGSRRTGFIIENGVAAVGAQLDANARDTIRAEIESIVRRAEHLRRFALENGDGPFPMFVPYRAPLVD